MKIVVTENSLRIDRIKINFTQIINLPLGLSFSDLKTIPYCKEIADGRIQIKGGNITASIYQAGGKVMLNHFEYFNGIELLREAVKLSSQDQSLMPTNDHEAYNFVPIGSVTPRKIQDFMLVDLPEILEEKCETIFEEMASSIMGSIRMGTGKEAFINAVPNSRSLSLGSIEGAADIIIPSGYDLLGDYNFMENLASMAAIDETKWETDKTHGKPADDAEKDCWIIKGRLYQYGTPFSIYIKDKNHPDYWQVRFELRPWDNSFQKILDTKLFNLSSKKRRLARKFESLLLDNVLPAARHLFDLDFLPLPKEERDLLMASDLKSLKTRDGHEQNIEYVDAIASHLMDNNLAIGIASTEFHTGIQASIRESVEFKPTARRGVYCFDRARFRKGSQ